MAYREQPEHSKPQSFSNDILHASQEHRDGFKQYPFPSNGQSRASSGATFGGQGPIQQPSKNAIGNAFDKSDTAQVVDPDLIAQITAEVKRSVLDEIKMSRLNGVTQQHPLNVLPATHIPPSPATSTFNPPLDAYTPQSPDPADRYHQSATFDKPLSRDSLFDDDDGPPTPRCETGPAYHLPRSRSPVHPASSTRATMGEFTPIEKMWQRLFDQDGCPLPRLGQFLKGLALHLIEDYEPKFSLVITPSKMLRFYNEVKLTNESYPWQAIFGRVPYANLSKIYRDMRCTHHLIQEHPAEQPYIPGLTPEGFQEWMTAMIQAYPDIEYERLAKAIMLMPISNADDRKERFPKELPRRLFPPSENLQAQQRCAATLAAEGVGPLRTAPTFPPPPAQYRTARAASAFPDMERERAPYPSVSEHKIAESEGETSTSVPIERQRKPYSACPGGGKFHDEDVLQKSFSHTDTTGFHEQKRRTQSTASQWVPPPPQDGHQQYPHPRTGSTFNNRRPRSPGLFNRNTKSDPTVRDIPAFHHTPNMHDPYDEDRKHGKEHDDRYYRYRKSTAGVDNESRRHS